MASRDYAQTVRIDAKDWRHLRSLPLSRDARTVVECLYEHREGAVAKRDLLIALGVRLPTKAESKGIRFGVTSRRLDACLADTNGQLRTFGTTFLIGMQGSGHCMKKGLLEAQTATQATDLKSIPRDEREQMQKSLERAVWACGTYLRGDKGACERCLTKHGGVCQFGKALTFVNASL